MDRAFKILTISNIPIKLHWTFPLLFLYVLYVYRDEGMNVQLAYSIFVIALFVCVVLHELGHAFAARRYGVDTVDIILSPIGGVARLKRLPTKPIQEFVVAIAGPLVNVAIAILIAISLFIMRGREMGLSDFDFNSAFSQMNLVRFLIALLSLNIVLVIFNLIPAFPMDGGRIFRSLLSMRFSRLLATRIATIIGQLVAVAFVGYSFISDENDFTLGFIGVFVFFAASSEYRMVKLNESLKKHSAQDLIRHPKSVLTPDMAISDAKPFLALDQEGDYIIQDETGAFRGILTRMALINAVKENRLTENIMSFASDKTAMIPMSESVSTLYQRMQQEELSDFIVLNEANQVAGIIDIKSVNEFLQQQRQIEAQKGIRGWLQRIRRPQRN